MIYGFIKESVILPSGSPVLNLTQVQWQYNNELIVWYIHLKTFNNRNETKFRLNKTDGSLQISNLHTEDSGIYNVKIIAGDYQKLEELNLTVVGRWAFFTGSIISFLQNLTGGVFHDYKISCLAG